MYSSDGLGCWWRGRLALAFADQAAGARAGRPPHETALESLESRTLFAIPLNTTSWTPIGPAPIAAGQTPGSLSVSGRIYAVAISPANANQIYAATGGGGVWRSNDGGANWSPLTDSQPTLFTSCVAIAPSNANVIYAGTGNPTVATYSYTGRGVLKSIDGGANWSLVGTSTLNRVTISQIVVSSADPNVVYASVSQPGANGGSVMTGVYKSTDGGANWSNTTSAISTADAFTDLAIDPANPNTLYCAVGNYTGAPANGVYKTTNGGTSWAPAGNFAMGIVNGWTRLAISKTSPQVIYAAVAGSNVIGSSSLGSLFEMYRSGDGGTTWNALSNTPNFLGNSGFFASALAVAPNDPDVVYAAGGSGSNSVIRSINAGQSWTDINTGAGGSGPHMFHHGLAVDSNGKLIDANDGGAFKYDPSTNQWSSLNANLNITQLIGIALDPSTANTAWAGAQDNGTSKFSGALSWSQKRSNNGGFVRVDYSSPNTVYHEYSFGSNFIQRSTDGGTNWTNTSSGISTSDDSNFYPPLVMDPTTPTRLIAGTNRVYLTTNSGSNWSAISTTNSGGWATDEKIDALATDKSSIYASAGGKVFVTANGGGAWNERDPVVSASTDLDFTDIEKDPTNSLVAYIVAANFGDVTGGPHVWKTTNGGTSWTSVSGNLPDIPVWSIELDTNGSGSADDILYIGTDAGVYRSSNGGATWGIFATGLPNAQVRDLEYNAALNVLAAGTYGRGMWEIQVDRTPLTADVINVSPDPRQTPVSSINIVFNKPVLGFDLSDLSLTRNGGSNLLTASQTLTTSDNITFTLNNLSGLTSTNGTYVLQVTGAGGSIIDAAGNSLSASASDTFVVGIPPTVLSSSFNDDLAQHKLIFQFSQNVSASLTTADLTVTNRSSGVAQTTQLLSYVVATNTATFIFPAYTNGTLPDGHYRAVLTGSGVTNPEGIGIQSNPTLDFLHFIGDANHDVNVNGIDFTAVAGNFNQSGRIWSQGDFNYDGFTNGLDFNAIASRFGSVFPPLGGAALPGTLPARQASVPSLFSDDRIERDDALAAL